LQSLPPEGIVARATQEDAHAQWLELNGQWVEVVKTEFGNPVHLPDFQEETWLIVSFITVQAAKAAGRPTHDLLVVSDVVRDKNGTIVGCRKFAMV
jgi:hypothetical protein